MPLLTSLRVPSLRAYLACAAFGLVTLLPAVAQSVPAPAGEHINVASAPASQQLNAEDSSAGVQDYLISPDDVLDVIILDVPEMSRTYRVSPLGTIKVPLLPQALSASGLSLEQFSDKLAAELKAAGLVSHPQVTTSVKESRAHSIAVAGAVRKPQIYAVLGKTTLLDVISQAEGLTDDAGTIAIVRRGPIAQASLARNGSTASTQGDDSNIERVDIKQLMESGDAALNIGIYPGDRITIPRAGLVYVVGAVNQPGGYPVNASKQGTTVLQAVALAKDIKPTSIPSKSMIIRVDPQAPQGRKQIPVDLKKVLAGKSPDPVLEAEDILFVPDSNSKKAFRRGVESILQVATGLAIYGRY